MLGMFCFFRLEAYDRNANLSASDVTGPEFKMDLPSIFSYKDIHAGADLPDLTSSDVDNYLEAQDKKSGNKGRALYEDHYVNITRWTEQNGGVYVKAVVRAEMKSNVVYEVDVLVKGKMIEQCQCECSAGMGPNGHCKHVVSI